ncbi:MAG TPA: YihY/virulence factor BrkB family protein [Anaerolineae bacterium]|nr:YihY/virulence factor BrkB family protein [Anaerolineae bacterium]
MGGKQAIENLIKGAAKLWRLVRETHRVFVEGECPLRAASLAYHLLLSLFPLLLFLIFVGSNLLSAQGTRRALDSYLNEVIPAVANSIRIVLDQTLQARGTIGLIGGALLIWSASAVFISLSTTLNVIWNAIPRPFWRRRILAMVTVLIVGSLFIVSIWMSAFVSWPWSGTLTTFWLWVSRGLDLGVTVLLLGLMYRLLPNRIVPWRAAFAGAFLAGLFWQIGKVLFDLFMSSGLPNYGLVYGSLATVVILMLWIYLSSLIILLGASFGSVLEREFL